MEDVLLIVDGEREEVEVSEFSSEKWLWPIRSLSPEEPVAGDPSSDATSRAEEGVILCGPMVTPDKHVLPRLSSDDESFRKRLDVIYVSREGVVMAPEHLASSPSELTMTRLGCSHPGKTHSESATIGPSMAGSSPDPVHGPRRITGGFMKRILP
ncbi:hypothetical protein R1sor_014161 [Riccia sorocarpa]|uniref:Uncharacterized protein n=1 Tax=Riccia sorocarpa TaxID=122646 RepID=A0ABD3HBM0_9MARC